MTPAGEPPKKFRCVDCRKSRGRASAPIEVEWEQTRVIGATAPLSEPLPPDKLDRPFRSPPEDQWVRDALAAAAAVQGLRLC
jgi:hypothetical protein